jgi:hypothetical protein
MTNIVKLAIVIRQEYDRQLFNRPNPSRYRKVV